MSADRKSTDVVGCVTIEPGTCNPALIIYRIEELENKIERLSESVSKLSESILGQRAARGALLGAAGILGGVVAFLSNLLLQIFHR